MEACDWSQLIGYFVKIIGTNDRTGIFWTLTVYESLWKKNELEVFK